MSCSKPLPPFNFDVLYYLNRDELERFSIVCRPLKNFIERYFRSKPYRVFSSLRIRGGLYALFHNNVHWHPDRDDYSVQQFLEMEFISYIWSSGTIFIQNAEDDYIPLVAIDFQPILNSPTILQCRYLIMRNAHFSFKDYKILYTINVIEIQPILSSSTIMKCHQLYMDNAHFSFKDYKTLYAVDIIYVRYHFIEIDDPIYNPSYWAQFFEQPGLKPVVVLKCMRPEHINNVLDHFSKAFSSAVSPNAFKIAFAEIDPEDGSLTEFRKTNNTSGEILELKEGFPPDRQNLEFYKNFDNYILERSSI
ncbi:hypothetical protein Ddc_18650 [Ditylenchus destructor]|nr:hypothetical protein Ddc_18650 [Ditylenchus destructor]